MQYITRKYVIFFKEEIQKVTVDYVKALEKYRKDYVEIEEFDHLDYDFEKYLNCDNDVQTCIDMTDEEIVNFCVKKPSVEIEEELEELSLENEPKKRIPTLGEAKSAYEIIYDRLSQSKDFDEEGLEILLKVENLLNKKIELKQKNINDYF